MNTKVKWTVTLALGIVFLCAPCSDAQIELRGLFTIETGSRFDIPGVSWGLLVSGTDGGLISGAYQPDPPPTVHVGDLTGARSLIDPDVFLFFGFPTFVSTNEIDPVDGITRYPVPVIFDHGDGTITADLSSWDCQWGVVHFNQGAPKSSAGNPAPSGTYEAQTGAYSLSWKSFVTEGAFKGSTGEWTLVGYGPAKQVDSDGDGYAGDDCDDDNPSIYPGATEICGNSLDENCDGIAEMCEVHDVAVTLLRVPKKMRHCSTGPRKIRAEIQNTGEMAVFVYVRLMADSLRLAGQMVVVDPGAVARVVFDLYPNGLGVGVTEICVEGMIEGTDFIPTDNRACGVTTVVECP